MKNIEKNQSYLRNYYDSGNFVGIQTIKREILGFKISKETIFQMKIWSVIDTRIIHYWSSRLPKPPFWYQTPLCRSFFSRKIKFIFSITQLRVHFEDFLRANQNHFRLVYCVFGIISLPMEYDSCISLIFLQNYKWIFLNFEWMSVSHLIMYRNLVGANKSLILLFWKKIFKYDQLLALVKLFRKNKWNIENLVSGQMIYFLGGLNLNIGKY